MQHLMIAKELHVVYRDLVRVESGIDPYCIGVIAVTPESPLGGRPLRAFCSPGNGCRYLFLKVFPVDACIRVSNETTVIYGSR